MDVIVDTGFARRAEAASTAVVREALASRRLGHRLGRGPAGLEVRQIRDSDVEARVRCGRASFTTSTMTPERYRRTFLGLSYRRDLDLVAVDDAGSVLAFALGWYDQATGIVELEPVGVDPGHHRRGLGTLICRSVIRAARDPGATRVMIAADRSNGAAVGLYRSLGLEIASVIVPFREAGATAPSEGH